MYTFGEVENFKKLEKSYRIKAIRAFESRIGKTKLLTHFGEFALPEVGQKYWYTGRYVEFVIDEGGLDLLVIFDHDTGTFYLADLKEMEWAWVRSV